MKALSMWQPHASLIADRHKRFETRGWATSYRGPLLICAAKRTNPEYERRWLSELFPRELWGYLFDFADENANVKLYPGVSNLSLGVALCVVDLRDIFRTEDPQLQCFTDEKELALGDFSPGHFAFDFQNIRQFVQPWPVRGRQGLFNVDDAEIARHELEAI